MNANTDRLNAMPSNSKEPWRKLCKVKKIIKKYNPNNIEYKLICNEHKLLWTEARFHHWIQNKKGSYDYLSHNYFFLVCYKVSTVWYEHKIVGEKTHKVAILTNKVKTARYKLTILTFFLRFVRCKFAIGSYKVRLWDTNLHLWENI